MEKIEIKKENVLAAYDTARKAGADSTMKVLESLFGAETFKPKNIMERIKTFEDALNELGDKHPLVLQYRFNFNNEGGWTDDMYAREFEAYLKLRIITAALNEGWEPQFTEDEWRYYPYFWLYTQKEIDEMEADEKQERRLMSAGGFQTEYAGFACAHSHVRLLVYVCGLRLSPLLKERHARRLLREAIHRPLGRFLPYPKKITLKSHDLQYG